MSNNHANNLLRVFSDGRATDDRRVTIPRTLNDVYAFPEYQDLAAWEKDAADIREHILACTGLLPMPEKCPLNPLIFGRIEREGYSVEKVLLETFPGVFLGGNLYRPLGKPGSYPAIINPHGHWPRGRIHNDPDLGSLPGRFINFALQGYVAFAYDMIGANDTFQLSHDFGGDREALWGISMLGLQLWNSIRAVDFVESLPGVDAARIGCTGASGGGSQTFLVTAIEPRIAASLPTVMVSAHMQGGCLCENAPSLRLKYSNVQVAACAAPRPLHLIACTRDWTKNMATVEFPAIQGIYRLYGAEDKVSFFIQDAEHNYNYNSRQSSYQFFGKVFLGETAPKKLQERPFEVESDDNLLALPDKRLLPCAKNRAKIVDMLIGIAQDQLGDMRLKDKRDLKAYQRAFGPTLQHAMSIGVPSWDELEVESLGTVNGDTYTAERLLLGRRGIGDKVPALLFLPEGKTKRTGTILVHEYGKAALMCEGLAKPDTLVAGLLAAGQPVLVVDTFLTGEFNVGLGARRNRQANHFTTYNRPDVVEKAQDILTGIAALKSRASVDKLSLAGLGEAGLWCLLAGAAEPKTIARLAADVADFESVDDAEFIERLNVPHIRRAGDLGTAATLFAGRPLLLFGCCARLDLRVAKAAYRAAGDPDALTTQKGMMSEKKLLQWLLGTRCKVMMT